MTEPKRYARAEDETGFTAVLRAHVEATPGTLGAVLVDGEGEAVDYVGDGLDPFDLKVAAAHLRIVLSDIERGRLAQEDGATQRLVVLTDRRAFALTALPDGYALLSIQEPTDALEPTERALDETLRALHREAGWDAPPSAFRWHRVEVELDDGARPRRVRMGSRWTAVVPIGRIARGLQAGELGWRVGVTSAACELTLVRGRDERWYGDVALSERCDEAATPR